MGVIYPANYNFKLADGNAILKGTDWYIEVVMADLENDIEKPINLTSYTGICQIREDANSETLLASPVVTILDPLGGSFSISLTEAETLAIPTTGKTYKDVSRYQYEVILKDDEGGDYRALHGFVEVSPTVVKE